MRKQFGLTLSSLQAVSSILLLGTSTLLLSTAALQPSVMLLMTMTTLVRAFAISRAGFRYAERLVLHDSAFRMLAKYRVSVFKALEPIAPLGLRRFGRGDLIARIVEDVDELQNLQLRVLPGLVQAVTASFLTALLFGLFSVRLGVVALLVMLISFSVAIMVSRKTALENASQITGHRGELYDSLLDLGTRSQVLQAFGWRSEVEAGLLDKTNKIADAEKGVARSAGTAGVVLAVGLALTQGVAALFGALDVSENPDHRVLLAGFLLLPGAVFEFYQLALPGVSSFERYRSSKMRVDEILQVEKPDSEDGKIAISEFESLIVEAGVVEFADKTALSIPKLNLSTGRSLAVTGRSGAGKTTLANILVGFQEASRLKLFVNGIQIDSISPNSLRERIGLVEQKPSVLAGTVAENLRIGDDKASDERLHDILDQVGLWATFVSREGLDTQVGEDATWLSGGEAARIAFARAILAKKKLVILDEPTAALDRENSHKLISELLTASTINQTAILLITHDQEIANLCDAQVSF